MISRADPKSTINRPSRPRLEIYIYIIAIITLVEAAEKARSNLRNTKYIYLENIENRHFSRI